MSHKVEFVKSGRGQAQCKPDPAYPNGIVLDLSFTGPAPHCTIPLPYPAPECGFWHVQCEDCAMGIMVTAAGRVDDPVSITVPCKRDLPAKGRAEPPASRHPS